MNDIYGKLREEGMGIETIAKLDGKGRITIPIKIREKQDKIKFYLCTYQDIIVLKAVD